MEIRDLVRDYSEGRLSRRGFLQRVTAAGVTATAAASLLEATERGEVEAAGPEPQGTRSGPGPKFIELTMPLDHQYMPDAYLPTATPFVLAPTGDPNKGFQIGTEAGTCLTLPSQFGEFRKTPRLHEIPTEKLVLRETAIVNIPKEENAEISPADVDRAVTAANLKQGDAVLLRTGWGDQEWYKTPGTRYLRGTPHFTVDAATRLAQAMQQRGSDLLLTDMALIAWPDKHLIPEWLALNPVPPPWPSPEATTYIATYTKAKMEADYAAALAFARAGVMTVKRLVNAKAVQRPRVQIIVGPLHLVRGVGSTARVVALEEA